MRKKIERHSILRFLLHLAIPFLLLFPLHLRAQETVDPKSGRLSADVTDLVLPAGAVNLKIRRTLLHPDGEAGAPGKGWKLNWEDNLTRMDPLVLVDGTAGTLSFWQDPNGAEYTGVSGERVAFDTAGRATRTRTDGSRDIYDEQGRLIERDLRNGNRVTLGYDPEGRLSRLEGPLKSAFLFVYGEDGLPARIEASTGAEVTYGYTDGMLTEVQVNGGPILRYGYDASGRLNRIDHPQTGPVLFGYDAEGRVTSRCPADGSEVRYEYDDEKNIRRVIDGRGGVTARHWSRDNRREEITDPLGNRTTVEYDEAGRPLKVSGPAGAVTEFAYDRLSRMVSITDPLGRMVRVAYEGDTLLPKEVIRADGAHVLYEYDAQLNLKSIRLGDQTLFAYTHAPDGQVTGMRGIGQEERQFTYHPDGRLKSVTDALGHATRFEYDERGNIVRETNAYGGVTIRGYDAQDRLVSERGPDGGTTLYAYDAQGRLARTTGPEGGTTVYGYDAMGHLVTETCPEGRTTEYIYDAAGQLVQVKGFDQRAEHYRYDLAGNLIEVTDPRGSVTRYEYDPAGNLKKEQRPGGLEVRTRYDASGNLAFFEDSSGSRGQYQYDALNRLISATDTRGASTRYEYDALGNVVAQTDPLGHVKRFRFTPEGQLKGVRDPNGDEASYEYNPAGLLAAVHRPSGGVTRFQYDEMGNLVLEKDPLGHERRYTYDQAGRNMTATDAAGGVTRFEYDKLGRIIQKRLPDGKTVTYRYNKVGQLLEADDGTFPVRFGYDAAGRIVRVEYPAINRVVGYEYDKKGLRKRLVLPDGRDIRYEHNALSQVSAIVLPGGEGIHFFYDEKGRKKTIAYPNGITGHWAYDPEGNVTEIQYEDKNGKVLSRTAYGLDPAGNIIERREKDGTLFRYAYDGAGQLVEESGPHGSTRYRYGPGGNRLQLQREKHTKTYAYDTADRMAEDGNARLAYNQKGNPIEREGAETKHYAYDSRDRLVQITGAGGLDIRYGYSATGERISRKDKAGLIYYIYDGWDLLQELGEDGAPLRTYVHAPGIDRPMAMFYVGKPFYYHGDRLGSIRLMTDQNGYVAASFEYDAFGNMEKHESAIPNPFTFTGREFDANSGLYYFRARYYDPEAGRFLTPDPVPPLLNEPLDQNAYLYVMNSPMRFTDPLGLAWDLPESYYEMGSAEQWLEYFRLLKHRAIQRGEPSLPTHDKMIHNLKNLLLREGRGVPPDPYTAPGLSTKALGNATGGGTPTQSGGGTRALGSRPGGGTVATSAGSGSAPKPTVSGTNVAGATGGVLAAIASAVNYQACREEGNSHTRCLTELGLGVAGGVVVGGVLVWTGVPAAVLATGGAVLAGAGSLAAGYRLSQAPETKAQQAQLAAQQMQAETRIKNVLANLEGQVAGLQKLGKEVCDKQAEVDASAKAAEKAAADAIKKIQSQMNAMSSDVNNNLTKRCTEAQDKLVKLQQKVKNAEEWAKNAKQGYGLSREQLVICVSQDNIKKADELLEAATALTLKAEQKYQQASSDISSLNTAIREIRNLAKDIKKRMGSLENIYASNLLDVKNHSDKTQSLAGEAKGKIAQFNAQKSALKQSISKLKGGAFPEKYHPTLNGLIGRIDNALPCPVKSQDDYVKRAQAAHDSLNVASPKDAGGLMGLVSKAPLASQKFMIDNAISLCGGLEPPKEDILKEAALAIMELNKADSWLKGISDHRALCEAKLAQPKPPVTTQPVTPPATTTTQTPPAPTLVQLVVSPGQVECEEGEKCPGFSATAIYSDKSQVDVTNAAKWWPPQPIRGISAGSFTVTASYSGINATGQVVVKAKPAPPAGGKKIVGEGVAPKQVTMRKGGRKPKFIWQFAYIDYSLPNTPVSSAEVPAVCGNIPDEPGTYTITCRAKDPVFGRKFEETATVIVYDPAIGSRFGGREGQRQQTVEGRLPQPPVLGYPPVGGHEGGIEGPNVPGRTPHEQIINEIIKSTPSVPQGGSSHPPSSSGGT